MVPRGMLPGEGQLGYYAGCTVFKTVNQGHDGSRCGPAVRRLAGKQKDLGSIRFGSPFSSKNYCGLWTLRLVTLPTPLLKH